MTEITKNSEVNFFVQMINSSGASLSDLDLTVQIVKSNQSAYADIAGDWVEVGNGTYRVSLNSVDTDTLGPSMVKITADGAVDQFVPIEVIKYREEITATGADVESVLTKVQLLVDNQLPDDEELAPPTPESVLDRLKEIINGPKSVDSDGVKVENHSIKDILDAEKVLSDKTKKIKFYSVKSNY